MGHVATQLVDDPARRLGAASVVGRALEVGERPDRPVRDPRNGRQEEACGDDAVAPEEGEEPRCAGADEPRVRLPGHRELEAVEVAERSAQETSEVELATGGDGDPLAGRGDVAGRAVP